jgi:hypothetical protein
MSKFSYDLMVVEDGVPLEKHQDSVGELARLLQFRGIDKRSFDGNKR